MDGTAIKAMMAELAPVIRDYIDEKFAPVAARLAAIEDGSRLENVVEPIARKEARRVAEQAAEAFKAITPESPPGLSAEGITETCKGIAAEIADGATAPLIERIAELESRPIPQVPEAEAIADAFRELAEKIVSDAVVAGLAALPPPDKGDPGEPGQPGKDGCGIADLLVDRDGALVASFDDGRMKNLGKIVGDPGEPGKDGRDGFDLEAFDCEPVDERTIELRFQQNGSVHKYELEFPVIIDRGVFKAGEMYKRGDAVTWGGSLWIAQSETAAKPETDDSWRLSVKKGRDGKDAK